MEFFLEPNKGCHGSKTSCTEPIEAAHKGTRRNEETQGPAQEDTKKSGHDKRTKNHQLVSEVMLKN